MLKIKTLVDQATFDEIFNLAISKAGHGMIFVEIGSFVGGSMCYLGQRLKYRKLNVNLFAIDNFKFDTISSSDLGEVEYYRGNFGNAFMDNIRRCDIKANVLVGDSIEKSKEFKDKSIDFLFIDGCHSYPYVEEELKVWMPKLKKNSMICGHDYNTNAVKMAVKNVIGDVFETSTGQSYYQIFGKGITKGWYHHYYTFLKKIGVK